MQLMTAWKDSLTLFKPGNFKLFSLVTLKSFIDTYKVWLTYWGWLVLLIIVGVYKGWLTPDLIPTMATGVAPFSLRKTFAGGIIKFGLWFSLYLSCRPSVKIKNWSYVTDYVGHFASIFYWPLILLLVFRAFYCGISCFLSFLNYILPPMSQPVLIVLFLYLLFFFYGIFTFWLSAFFVLLFLDSSLSVKNIVTSLGRAAKMLWYNIPACVVLALIFATVYIALFYVLLIVHGLLGIMVNRMTWFFMELFIYLPLLACITTNFYIKKLHEQFTLYFGEKS